MLWFSVFTCTKAENVQTKIKPTQDEIIFKSVFSLNRELKRKALN